LAAVDKSLLNTDWRNDYEDFLREIEIQAGETFNAGSELDA